MRRAILLIALAAAGCGVSREARIEAQLERAGVKPKLARCMAGKLDRDLSDAELMAIREARRTPGDDRPLGRRALLDRIAAIDDPHIVDTVSRAALGCAILH